ERFYFWQARAGNPRGWGGREKSGFATVAGSDLPASNLEIGHVQHDTDGAPFVFVGPLAQTDQRRAPRGNLRIGFVWLTAQFTAADCDQDLVELAQVLVRDDGHQRKVLHRLSRGRENGGSGPQRASIVGPPPPCRAQLGGRKTRARKIQRQRRRALQMASIENSKRPRRTTSTSLRFTTCAPEQTSRSRHDFTAWLIFGSRPTST